MQPGGKWYVVSHDRHSNSLQATTEKQFFRLEMIEMTEVRVSAGIYSKHIPVEWLCSI